jgi:hypothetical protein
MSDTKTEQGTENAYPGRLEMFASRFVISLTILGVALLMVTPLHEFTHCFEGWIRSTSTDPCTVVYYHPMERGPGGLLGAAWTETSHYTHVWMWRIEAVVVFTLFWFLARWTTAPLRPLRRHREVS